MKMIVRFSRYLLLTFLVMAAIPCKAVPDNGIAAAGVPADELA